VRHLGRSVGTSAGLGANLSPSVTHLLTSASLLPVELY
jgi:hypothetical protein